MNYVPPSRDDDWESGQVRRSWRLGMRQLPETRVRFTGGIECHPRKVKRSTQCPLRFQATYSRPYVMEYWFWDRASLYRRQYIHLPERAPQALAEYRKIYAASQARDVVAASQAVQAYIRQSAEEIFGETGIRPIVKVSRVSPSWDGEILEMWVTTIYGTARLSRLRNRNRPQPG